MTIETQGFGLGPKNALSFNKIRKNPSEYIQIGFLVFNGWR